jgi:hypothetical protein
VLPSVKVPVAVNFCWVPLGIEGLMGVTAREASSAAVMVRVVEPSTSPIAAEMRVVPLRWAEARPREPGSFDTLAAAGAEEVHSRAAPSLKVPVAWKRRVVPAAMEGSAGVTARVTRAAGRTVRVVEPLTLPSAARMAAVPSARASAFPFAPLSFLTEAIEGAPEDHSTLAVRSFSLPLE